MRKIKYSNTLPFYYNKYSIYKKYGNKKREKKREGGGYFLKFINRIYKLSN